MSDIGLRARPRKARKFPYPETRKALESHPAICYLAGQRGLFITACALIPGSSVGRASGC